MLITLVRRSMDRGADDDRVALEVELPPELLTEIDRYAVRNGYQDPGTVVSTALERHTSR
jgi:metal-responsive CopG/Arc/MetJ family transcriptional regulator